MSAVASARPSKLERRFAARLGHDHAAAFGQGRTALWAALTAAGVEGGRVLVPALTCQCVVNAVIAAGAEPVFFDVDPMSLEPDPQRLERLMPDVRALIAIDYFGWPCRALGPLTEAARAHGVVVIDDRAQLLSGGFRQAGPGPDYTIYSLVKMLPCPAGGMLATADPEKWAAAVRARDGLGSTLRGALARERHELERLAGAVTQRFGPSRSPDAVAQNGDAELRDGKPPSSPGMGRITYGFAAVAMRSLASRQQRARAVGLRLQDRLAPIEALPRARSLTDPESAFLFFPMLLRDAKVAEAISHARSQGVHLQSAWELHRRCSPESVPGTTYVRDHLVVWPVDLHISDAEVDVVARVLGECARMQA